MALAQNLYMRISNNIAIYDIFPSSKGMAWLGVISRDGGNRGDFLIPSTNNFG